MGETLSIEWLGTVPYDEGLELQHQRVAARARGEVPDALLLLEHPPVVTFGCSARAENLLVDRAELAARGVAVHDVARGGDVTYHGPGQLVGYLVLDLEERGEADAHRFLRRIEATLVAALAELGVAAEARPGMTGVYIAPAGAASQEATPRKIASIGVALRGWISSHGFALNVDVDLDGFRTIIPCGLENVEMTSLARELAPRIPEDLGAQARAAVCDAFAKRW